MRQIVKKVIFKLLHLLVNLLNTILFFFLNKDKVLVVNGWMEFCGNRPLHQNFGDELNYYLLKELSGRQIVNYKNLYIKCTNYCCIGSVIDSLVDSHTVVWGAGLISDKATMRGVPQKVCAVRGTLSRELLLSYGVECPEIYGDPALLLPLIYNPSRVSEKKYIGIIPHIADLNDSKVRELSSEGGKVIRLCGYKIWRDIVDEINQCEFVISSSLHGVIISDAYNIPNVWVEFSNKVVGNGFKFRDYYSSVRRDIPKPVRVDNSTRLEELLECKKQWKPIDVDLKRLLNACPFEIKEKYRNNGVA